MSHRRSVQLAFDIELDPLSPRECNLRVLIRRAGRKGERGCLYSRCPHLKTDHQSGQVARN